MRKLRLVTSSAILSVLLAVTHLSAVQQEASSMAIQLKNTVPDGPGYGILDLTKTQTKGVGAAPTKAAATAPTAPAPVDGGGGYDGYSGGYVDPGAYSADDTSYLSGDASYQAQLAALLKAAADQEADFTAQKSKYEVDYGDALKGLGWMQDDPNTPVNEAAWNLQDQNTASGRAYTNQQNDFASRGTIQSSGYATALDNLMRSLNDQLGGINTNRQSFLDDLARQQSAAQSENQLSQQQAKTDALYRRAGGLSIV